MISAFNRPKFFEKRYVGILPLIIPYFVLIIISSFLLRSEIQNQIHLNKKRAKADSLLKEIKNVETRAIKMFADSRGHLLTREENFILLYRDDLNHFLDSFDKVRREGTEFIETSKLNELEDIVNEMLKYRNLVIEYDQTGKDIKRLIAEGKGTKILTRLQHHLESIADEIENRKNKEVKRTQDERSYIFFSCIISLIFISLWNLRGLFKNESIFTEIHNQKKKLELAEKRFRMMFESAHDSMLIVDRDAIITFVNNQACDKFGYRSDELLGKKIEILIPDDFRDSHIKKRNLYMKKPISRTMGQDLLLHGRKKDGSLFPVEITLTPITVNSGLEIATIVRDVTTQKMRELREITLSQLGEALISLDIHANLHAVAEICIQNFGEWTSIVIQDSDNKDFRIETSSINLNEKPLFKYHPSKEVLFLKELSPEFVRQEAKTPEAEIILRELQVKSFIKIPLIIRDNITGTFSIISIRRVFEKEDINLFVEMAKRISLSLENYQLYKTTQRAVQIRENVVSVVSHDLKGPLMSIQLTGHLILKKMAQHDLPEEFREEVKKRIHNISLSTEQATRLIQDLMDITKINAGNFELSFSPLSTNILLEKVTNIFQPIAENQSLNLSQQDHFEGLIDCDENRIIQVLSNLVSNAIKHTSPGGQIKVEAMASNGHCRFSVLDSGHGIKSEDIPYIFDRFWYAKSSRENLGLGLTIAKGIVERHHGKIWVESTLGKGSTFYFEIPVKQS